MPKQPKPLVFDATPLIYLTKFSLSDSLKNLSVEKLTTAKVFAETVEGGNKRSAPEASLLEALFNAGVLTIKEVQDTAYLEFVRKMAAANEKAPLHQAEAEVLCLARELHGIAVSDDLAARSVAKLLKIELHGTGYILGRLHGAGIVEKKTLIRKVSEMREGGWRVSAEDYLKIVEYLKKL